MASNTDTGDQTVAERTPANQPSSVEENNYKAHVFRTAGRTPGGLGLAGESPRQRAA